MRHNEDKVNVQMASDPGIRFPVDTRTADDPHTKANLLLQAHFSRLVGREFLEIPFPLGLRPFLG